MGVADAVVAVLVLLGLVFGWRQGLVRASLELLAVAGAAVAAWLLFGYAAWWLTDRLPGLEVWVAPLSMSVIFIAVMLLIAASGRRLLRRWPMAVRPAWLHRGGGVLAGVANGLLQAAVGMALLGPAAKAGWLAPAISQASSPIEARIGPVFDPALRDMRHVISLPDRPDATVALDYRLRAATVRPDLEARLLELVNAERARHGLAVLMADPELSQVARAHSSDMFARGYFSHYAPDGASMDDRLRRYQVRYRIAGENLALARSLTMAHEGLMKSPGHRANILRPQFGRLGIGVLDGGTHGLMVTQNFRD
ncbi:hypothetical protein FN976_08715 [Caenimonas sedimenti]|uniref:SCP domain-containing protein n=1 Tax=Caenimonas sedimenti TaxID=2596921 RepID=A0A562ZU71_9BURK|nr:CvpA family protein [Caenimonas sedimenti]TWO71684.1 hypothetical protein FN976_08715 [Caenimonas sedimenti]